MNGLLEQLAQLDPEPLEVIEHPRHEAQPLSLEMLSSEHEAMVMHIIKPGLPRAEGDGSCVAGVCISSFCGCSCNCFGGCGFCN